MSIDRGVPNRGSFQQAYEMCTIPASRTGLSRASALAIGARATRRSRSKDHRTAEVHAEVQGEPLV